MARILAVDDNPNNLKLLQTVLESQGHTVHIAQSGNAALRAVVDADFDIALIDIRMPQMSGYELCERLKAWHRTRDMPVIFLSALDDVTNKVQAFESGGDDYIVKPFKVAEVLARVTSRIRSASIHREISQANDSLRRENAALLRMASGDSANVTPGGSELALLTPDERQGLFNGKYVLGERIGRGGFGEVYSATHAIINRPVAIKILRGERIVTSFDAARVRLEGISACRVDHPHAIAIWDAGVTPQGILFLVMELLTGRSLRDELMEIGMIAPERCLHIARVVCDVLRVAHASGVIHRDVKPDNIFLHLPREGRETVKVLDFGIAKLTSPPGGNANTLGPMTGTPEYLAPERLLSKAYDGRSDIYSLGCMMYEMLVGRVPFVADKEQMWMVAARHINEEPEPLHIMAPELPLPVAKLVHATLAKDPNNRPTAAQLLLWIDELLEGVVRQEYTVTHVESPTTGVLPRQTVEQVDLGAYPASAINDSDDIVLRSPKDPLE